MLSTSLLSLLALVSLATADQPVHVPLSRRSVHFRNVDGSINTDRLGNHAALLRGKYGFGISNSTKMVKKRASSAGIGIINQERDSSYLGSVSLGTPPQTFNVVLDTGSSDFWLASTQCTSCSIGTPAYDPSKSSSFKQSTNALGQAQSTNIRYGSGEVAGIIAAETVSMGGFTVPSQTMLVATDLSSGLLDGDAAGIMGLAFSALAATRATPFWEALLNGNQLTDPEMSFWLTREVDNARAQQDEFGGVFTLGGTNSTLFQGDIEFLDMPAATQPTFWLLNLSGATVGGKAISLPSSDSPLSAIDTGTTLIGGPSASVQAIYAQVPGSQELTGNMAGFFAYPCTQDISVAISFGGKTWPISSADMNLGSVGNGFCLGGIFDLTLGSNVGSGGGNPSWVVGDTFLKNVYSVFRANPPSIGFAQLSDSAGGSSGSPVAASGFLTASATFTQSGVPLPSGTTGSSGTSGASTTSASFGLVSFVLATLVSAFLL
ncbi:aspartic peptidase domain-containing protein [Abortiporus biennis]|nr:aspartic peptidase domain-containing protein [Abortiporus biennis]